MGATSDAVTEPGDADWLEDPIELGATMGRYELRRILGAGGMGVVFEAVDPELARPVAIKVLRAASGHTDDDAEARLRRESRSMAQLTHPNVIRVYDVGVAHGHAFVAMELVVGTTLTGWLAAAPRTPAEIIAVFAQAGRGLAAAHAVGLVHRDFKPGNVMVGDDGRVLVTDFGLARGASGEGEPPRAGGAAAPVTSVASTITVAGEFVGTPAYMAPEQYSSAPVDARADQFSFCVALWRALFGAPPFAGETIDQLAAAAEAGAIVAPRPEVVGRASPAVRAALERGMNGDPALRFPALAELLAVLAPRVAPSAPPRNVAAWIGAAVVAGAGAVAIWAVATRSPDAPARAPIAVVMPDAARPIDAPSPRPPPDAARAPVDDTVVVMDAAIVRAFDAAPARAKPPRPRPSPSPSPDAALAPDPPDDYSDPMLVRRALVPIFRASARCGTWVDHEYSGSLVVDNKGVTSKIVVTGPDPALVACMTAILEKARFPETKFGGEGINFEYMRP